MPLGVRLGLGVAPCDCVAVGVKPVVTDCVGVSSCVDEMLLVPVWVGEMEPL